MEKIERLRDKKQLSLSCMVAALLLLSWVPGVNAIEPRVTEFPIAHIARPIVGGPDGNIWFGGYNFTGRITPTGEVTEFPVFGSWVSDMAVGADGNVWLVSELRAAGADGAVARVTPSGQVTEFPFSTKESDLLWPKIASGPGERLAFADGSEVGWVDMNGAITRFRPPSSDPRVTAVAYDSVGDIWFTDGGQIGRLTVDGSISEYPIPGKPHEAGGIALGADGNLWFTIPEKGTIGRITVGGQIRMFPGLPLPTAGEETRSTAPGNLVEGPDGRLWFSESGTGLIGWVNPVHRTIKQLRLPSNVKSHLQEVAAGPEGDIWYTGMIGVFEGGGGTHLGSQTFANIGRITPESLTIRIAAVHASAGYRQAKVRLACGGGLARNVCRGRLRLSARMRGPHGARRWVRLAQEVYAVPTDTAEINVLELSARAQALIHHHPQLRVRALARSRGGSGDLAGTILHSATG